MEKIISCVIIVFSSSAIITSLGFMIKDFIKWKKEERKENNSQ